MILHRLIGHHLKYGDDAAFYRMQAEDAITWEGDVNATARVGKSGDETNEDRPLPPS